MSAYFDNVTDHLDKIWDALDEYKEIIEGINATHDSLASNRINDILRVLTILGTVGTVLTVIVSIYGMNIPIPAAGRRRRQPACHCIRLDIDVGDDRPDALLLPPQALALNLRRVLLSILS